MTIDVGTLVSLVTAATSAAGVIVALVKWLTAIRKNVAEVQALHKSVDRLKEALGGLDLTQGTVRERLAVLEDRSNRDERMRLPTPVEGVPHLTGTERSKTHRIQGEIDLDPDSGKHRKW